MFLFIYIFYNTEQDANTQDGAPCTTNENCLQANHEAYDEYLQCDPL